MTRYSDLFASENFSVAHKQFEEGEWFFLVCLFVFAVDPKELPGVD